MTESAVTHMGADQSLGSRPLDVTGHHVHTAVNVFVNVYSNGYS
jgi:hypothetical protein